VVEGTGRQTAVKRKTSFFKAIISQDARQKRRTEIQEEIEEKERQIKRRAWIEATCLSTLVALFGASMSTTPDLALPGVILLVSAILGWSSLYRLSFKHGPLLKATQGRGRRSSQDKTFHGPRGGRFRMSADGKRRIYF
jgi:hypothetical protein